MAKRTTKKDIESLAIAYHAYATAKDDLDTMLWGPMLIEAQDKTGVELMNPIAIKSHVNIARRNRQLQGLCV